MNYADIIRQYPDVFKREYYRTVNKGTYILQQHIESDYIFYLLKGVTVVYSISEEGDEDILTYYTAGDFAGIQNAFKGEHEEKGKINILTKTDCIFYQIPKQCLVEHAHRNPKIFELLLNSIGREYREFRNQYRLLQQNKSANILCKILYEFSEEIDGRLIIEKWFTFYEIANYLKINVATVSRIIKMLKEEQILAIEKKKIIIINKEQFINYVHGEKLEY